MFGESDEMCEKYRSDIDNGRILWDDENEQKALDRMSDFERFETERM